MAPSAGSSSTARGRSSWAGSCPGLRIVTAVACGVFEVPFRVFFPAMSLGALLYILVYTLLGYFLRTTGADRAREDPHPVRLARLAGAAVADPVVDVSTRARASAAARGAVPSSASNSCALARWPAAWRPSPRRCCSTWSSISRATSRSMRRAHSSSKRRRAWRSPLRARCSRFCCSSPCRVSWRWACCGGRCTDVGRLASARELAGLGNGLAYAARAAVGVAGAWSCRCSGWASLASAPRAR